MSLRVLARLGDFSPSFVRSFSVPQLLSDLLRVWNSPILSPYFVSEQSSLTIMTVPEFSMNPFAPPREAYILAFDVLASCGFVFLGAILVTAMASKGTRRRGTWYSLIIAWMTYSAAYLLILGRQTGPEPVFGLCTLQAALIYGTPAL
jgi:hypothetical protein